MKIFNYKVKDKNGKTLKGIIEAGSEKQAAALLRDQEFSIISLKVKSDAFLSSFKNIFSKISEGDVVEFTRQLSTMINAGLPLTEALIILRDQTKNKLMAKVIDHLLGEIQGGSSLAKAMEKHPKVFPKVYIALISAGEAAGVLDNVSLRLADNLEKSREFTSKAKGALIYPAIISILMVVVMIVMMIFVFPKLTSMYKEFNIQLPAPTRILMTISDFSVKFFPIISVALVIFGFFLSKFLKTDIGRLKLDQFLFKIPLVGKLKKQIALTEFARTLGLLIGTGIPIIEALNIVADAVGNAVYQKAIKESALEVERGFALAIPISQNPDFPAIVGQMIRIGEESGKMDEVLGKLSHFFEAEAEHLIKGLTTAIEPIIMIILGLGVGFLVISVIMPIYSLTSQF